MEGSPEGYGVPFTGGRNEGLSRIWFDSGVCSAQQYEMASMKGEIDTLGDLSPGEHIEHLSSSQRKIELHRTASSPPRPWVLDRGETNGSLIRTRRLRVLGCHNSRVGGQKASLNSCSSPCPCHLYMVVVSLASPPADPVQTQGSRPERIQQWYPRAVVLRRLGELPRLLDICTS